MKSLTNNANIIIIIIRTYLYKLPSYFNANQYILLNYNIFEHFVPFELLSYISTLSVTISVWSNKSQSQW